MTDNNHPITPSPYLVEEWRIAPEYTSGREKLTMVTMTTRRLQEIATQAAHWGADQELEACCEHLKRSMSPRATVEYLRASRRPNPPSLKEQALEEIQEIEGAMYSAGLGCDFTATRRALESLPD